MRLRLFAGISSAVFLLLFAYKAPQVYRSQQLDLENDEIFTGLATNAFGPSWAKQLENDFALLKSEQLEAATRRTSIGLSEALLPCGVKRVFFLPPGDNPRDSRVDVVWIFMGFHLPSLICEVLLAVSISAIAVCLFPKVRGKIGEQ